MKSFQYTDADFKVVYQNEGWKIGLLRCSERFSALTRMERHLCTDEVFVLLSGQATLYVCRENKGLQEQPLERDTVYAVEQGEWHHLVVSAGATVLVAENGDTSKENTEVTMNVQCCFNQAKSL